MLPELSWVGEEPQALLLAMLDRDGEEARVVGGAVRDALLGLKRRDREIDVATTALPPEVIRRAEASGFKVVLTGVDHGTVTVLIQGRPFEVTTLREDVETFGRHATVKFGRNWKRDAQRRDFTMNGLSLSADGTVHDHVGGVADIEARRVRFIGDASKRIAEDYLRILRFFRFHACYGEGHPDAEGLHASIAARAGLEQLSRERVRMELMKLFTAPHAVPVLAVMAEAGLLGQVLGGVPHLASFSNIAKVEVAAGLVPDATRRLGALGVWIAEDAERLLERLRLSNAQYARLAALDGWWRVSPAMSEASARELIYRIGPEHFTERVLLAWARSWDGARAAEWHVLATLPRRWSAPAFPIKAADFIARGVEKGPSLGAALARAEEAWIRSGFPLDQRALNGVINDALGG